jgi:carbon monoxide dehydrogenase subunit G
MVIFTGTVESGADITAAREAVWAALTDPVLLPKLTPLLTSIDADGDVWRWHMMRIAALGVSVAPVFTEKMTFDHGRRISYEHQPPPGTRERAGAHGEYELSDIDGGTHLRIKLSLCLDLPLPRSARGPVTSIIRAMMNRTGERFSANLLEHLQAREIGTSAINAR